VLITDPDVLAAAPLETLDSLTLSEPNITDLSPLRRAVGLTRLVLNEMGPVDITPLTACSRLVQLSIYDTPVADFSPLMALPALRELTVGATAPGPSSIPLAFPPWLTTLSLFVGEPHNDLSAIQHLTGLEHLSVYGGTVVGDGLCSLSSLTRLQLTHTATPDLSFLSALPQLADFWSMESRLVDLSGLAGATELRRLLLGHNHIADISPLAGLLHLDRLGLRANRIAVLPPLSLPALRTREPVAVGQSGRRSHTAGASQGPPGRST
jgi:Leucine-rich repeat (LRR) protein